MSLSASLGGAKSSLLFKVVMVRHKDLRKIKGALGVSFSPLLKREPHPLRFGWDIFSPKTIPGLSLTDCYEKAPLPRKTEDIPVLTCWNVSHAHESFTYPTPLRKGHLRPASSHIVPRQHFLSEEIVHR